MTDKEKSEKILKEMKELRHEVGEIKNFLIGTLAMQGSDIKMILKRLEALNNAFLPPH